MAKQKAKFDLYVSQTISFETGGDKTGAYTNDPSDKGGETKWGVSKSSFPDLNIKNLKFDEASKIYFAYYYNELYEMILSDRLAFKLFDMGVLTGPQRAIKKLQKVVSKVSGLKLKKDGIFGPMTLTAINLTIAKQGKELNLYKEYIEIYKWYFNIIAFKWNNMKYLNGWMNRLNYEWQE